MQKIERRSLFLDSLAVHRIDWVVVFAYFDETGTSGGAERLTAVAGYLFDRVGADRFWDLYKQNVEPLLPYDERRKNKMFHAAPCALGYEPFKGMPEPDRNEIIERLVKTILETVTMGTVVALEPGDYTAGLGEQDGAPLLPNGRKLSLEPWIGSKYSLCLMRCIQQMVAWMNHNKIDGLLEYVFEAGCNQEDEANHMMSMVAKSEELTRRYHLNKYSFTFKGPDTPWLAAPDLLAWEWQRADRNRKEPYRKEWRKTMADLVDAKPHTASYLSPIAIGIQAMVHSFYGVTLLP